MLDQIAVNGDLPYVGLNPAFSGTPTPTPPSTMLMSSRLAQMGCNGFVGSNGTDTDSNSRIASWNETGATVNKLRAYFTNWMANATNEQDGYNAIAVTAAIEYPSGTLTQVTFSSAASVSIAATGSGNLVESDEITISGGIPAGAQFWIRTFVSVTAGNKWCQGYVIQNAGPNNGELADFSTGVDKTMSGTIVNATPNANRRGYGPVAIKATSMTGTPVAKAFAAVGDSRIMGSGDVQDTGAIGHGNSGYFAKACAGNYPVVNLGIAGTAALNNLPVNFSRRAALIQKIGITHIFCNWSINDINAGQTAAQLAANVATIAANFKTLVPGVKVIWANLAPYTTGTWLTVAGQTVKTTPSGAFTGGSSSQRSVYNADVRAGISGVDTYFEEADPVEVNSSNVLTRDGGFWISGNGGVGSTSVHLTTTGATTDEATADGLHPTVTNTTSFYGGIYILRDAVRAVFSGW